MTPGTVTATIYVRVCTSAGPCGSTTASVSVTASASASAPAVTSASPRSMTANGQTQTLTVNGSGFASGNVVQFYWTQGSGANDWTTANGTPTINSETQLTIGMNPGTVTDTIYVRVCTSAGSCGS